MIAKLHMDAAKRMRLGKAAALALLVAAVNVGMAACARGEELTMNGTISESVQDGSEDGNVDEAPAATHSGTKEQAPSAAQTADGTDAEKAPDTEKALQSEQVQNVVVYLCGAVENAGVYELPEGSRVVDAIRMAGGLTLMADETCVNQARILVDGEQIYIWTMEEKSAYQRGENVTVPEAAEGTAFSESSGKAGSGLVNLNTASQEELTTLPGIGDAKAAAIIAYRQEHGGFSAAEELKNVSGIGDATYEKLKDRIEKIP